METLISNKIHPIQDARLVAEFDNKLDRQHAKSCLEELYLKKSGGYFLYGRGGDQTVWAQLGGEGIKMLTIKQAQEWIMLHHNDHEKYADLWKDAEE